MGRDRFVKTEWNSTRLGAKPGDFGYDDDGRHLAGEAERLVYEDLKAQGYNVYKHGWPDFMAIRKNGIRYDVRLIEVKSSADRQRENQLRNHRGLAQLGADVETIIKMDSRPGSRVRVQQIVKTGPTRRKTVI